MIIQYPSEIKEEEVVSFFKSKIEEINSYIKYLKLSPYNVIMNQTKTGNLSILINKEIIIPYFPTK